jgi:membrane protein
MFTFIRGVVTDILHNPGYTLLQLHKRKSRIRYPITLFLVYCRIVFSEYALNHCVTRSSSLAYILLLAIIPLITTAAFMVGGFIDVRAEEVRSFFLMLLPFAPDTVLEYISVFFVNAKKVRGAGLAVLIVVSVGLFGSVEESFNTIWKVTRSRTFFSRLRSFTMVMVYSPILFFLSFQFRRSPWFELLSDRFQLLDAVPFLLMVLAFTSMISFVPNTRVGFKPALAGGLISGILFEIERRYFYEFVMMSVETQTIYGAVAMLPLFLVSLFLATLIILFGAQAAYALQHFKPLLRAKKRWDRRVGDYRTYITFRMMFDCVEAYLRKRHPPSLRHFCLQYELTDSQASGILNWLIHEGFLHKIGDGKPAYVPTRDFSHTPVVAIIDTIENQNRRVSDMPDDDAKPVISSLLENISRQSTSSMKELTFELLIEQMELEQRSRRTTPPDGTPVK